MNGVLKNIATESITGTNNLTKAYTILIVRNVGLKPNRKRTNEMKEPWWKRINETIKVLRKHINIFKRKRRGDLKKKKNIELEQKYRIKKKGLNVVLE